MTLALQIISQVTAQQLDGDLIVKLLCLASIVGNIVQAFRPKRKNGEQQEISNNPLVVTAQEKCASREAFSRHVQKDEQEHRRIEDKCDEAIHELKRAGEERGENINTKLDRVLHEMGDIKGTVGELKGKVAELTRRAK